MRATRLLLPALLVLLLVLVGAVLVVPSLLDWNRYRGEIAALASATIGRQVSIGGDVTLRLLPAPTFAASDISVADSGDGVTLQARSLRLQVAALPLFTGRVDVRELVLDRPELRLPWPLGYRPAVARPPAFLQGVQARVEDGRLAVGGVLVTGIDAGFSVDALTGGIAAAGAGHALGGDWSFTTRLSSPDGSGTVGLDIALDGQGALRDTGGTFTGRIAADGSVDGRVAGRGPDLSLLLPAPAQPWQAEGRFIASGGLAAAPDLALQIGGSASRGAVSLRLIPAPRLDVALAASRLDLDAWAQVLTRAALPRATLPGLSTGVDLSAEAASLGGGQLRRLRAGFDLAPGGITLRQASVLLPGDAALDLSGTILPGPAPEFAGSATLQAPDLRSTLRWLANFAPAPVAALPEGVLRQAQLGFRLRVGAGRVSLDDLSGTVDAQAVAGGLSVSRSGGRTALAVGLSLPVLALDSWLGADPPDPRPALAGFDLDLHLQAARASWRELGFERLAVDAASHQGLLALRQASADLHGLHLAAAATLGASGQVSDGVIEVTGTDARPLAALLPPDWRATPALWQGPVALRATLAGPPGALAVRLGLDLADARLEARALIDLPGRRLSGPVTLRHPGAPRLLQDLGLPGAPDWLGPGSLSLAAQVTLAPGHVAADSFQLAAGSLRAAGALALEAPPASGSMPVGPPALTGRIDAETLPLPLPAPRGGQELTLLPWLRQMPGWRADVALHADELTAGGGRLLQDVACRVRLDGGRLLLDGLSGTLEGGRIDGALALDAAAEPPRLHVAGRWTGARLSGPLFDLPVDIGAGQLDAQASLDAAGHSPAAALATLSGTLHASARDGRVVGFDLAALRAALQAGGPGALDAARAALSGGDTAFDTLGLAGTLSGGVLTLAETGLRGPAGTVALTGGIDIGGAGLDLHATLLPALPDAPQAGLVLAGPAAQPHVVPQLADLARFLAAVRPAGERGDAGNLPQGRADKTLLPSP